MRKILNMKRIFIILLIIVITTSFIGCNKEDEYVPQLRLANSLSQFYYNFELILRACENSNIPIDQEFKDRIKNDVQLSVNYIKTDNILLTIDLFRIISVYEYFVVEYDKDLYTEKLETLYDAESKCFFTGYWGEPFDLDSSMIINRILILKLHDSSIDISYADDILIEKLNTLDIDDNKVAYQYLYELSLMGSFNEVNKPQLVAYFAENPPTKSTFSSIATPSTSGIYKYSYFLEFMELPHDNISEEFREMFVSITEFDNFFNNFNGPTFLAQFIFEQNPYDFYGENEYFRDNINNWLVNYYNEYRSTIFYYA